MNSTLIDWTKPYRNWETRVYLKGRTQITKTDPKPNSGRTHDECYALRFNRGGRP